MAVALTLFLTFCVLILSNNRISIYSILETVSEQTHIFCLNALPAASSALPELKALVCGENFSDFGQSSLYIATGLIHLFVVSGAHLLLIKKILEWSLSSLPDAWPKLLTVYGALFIFSAACQFNAPITRALIAIGLTDFLKSRKTHWPPHYRLLIAGLCCLVFQPRWLQSTGLQLSWLIALGQTINAQLFQEEKKARQKFWHHLLHYFLIFPTLLFFQVPSPIIIVVLLLFSPFLEFVLFPLGLLVCVAPFLYPSFDLLIEALRRILSLTEMNYQFQTEASPPYFLLANWALIFFVHLFLHTQKIRKETSPCA